jgi:hypothetical protein
MLCLSLYNSSNRVYRWLTVTLGGYSVGEQRLGAVRRRKPPVYLEHALTRSPRYLLEHGLKADGRPDPDAKDLNEGGSFETFFTETGSGKYVPRSIFVDLDPSVRRKIPRSNGGQMLIDTAH